MGHYSAFPETIIIVGLFERFSIAEQSLTSLFAALDQKRVKVIISDASSRPLSEQSKILAYADDYIWTPKTLSMASARNVAYQLAIDKYCSDWILFAEDDIIYSLDWYENLIDFAERASSSLSPQGMPYGCFSASSEGVNISIDTTDYDSNLDCYSSLFGVRADQRLFKSSVYSNIAKFWDSDLLGISSAQTGKQNHRLLMRGYVGGCIGHRNLCSFVDGEVSTWANVRDIGPAAFDKRLNGYKSLIKTAKSLSYRTRKYDEISIITPPVSILAPPFSSDGFQRPMTSKPQFEVPSLRIFLRRILRAFRILVYGK